METVLIVYALALSLLLGTTLSSSCLLVGVLVKYPILRASNDSIILTSKFVNFILFSVFALGPKIFFAVAGTGTEQSGCPGAILAGTYLQLVAIFHHVLFSIKKCLDLRQVRIRIPLLSVLIAGVWLLPGLTSVQVGVFVLNHWDNISRLRNASFFCETRDWVGPQGQIANIVLVTLGLAATGIAYFLVYAGLRKALRIVPAENPQGAQGIKAAEVAIIKTFMGSFLFNFVFSFTRGCVQMMEDRGAIHSQALLISLYFLEWSAPLFFVLMSLSLYASLRSSAFKVLLKASNFLSIPFTAVMVQFRRRSVVTSATPVN